MPVLDVFNGDAYSLVNMTEAVQKLPYVPSRIGSMGLFKFEGVTTPNVGIEMENGKLMLVPTQARGTMPNVGSGTKRKVRVFQVPHIPLNTGVNATDVEGIRSFGTADGVDPIASVINTKMEWMKQQLELTREYHRIGAINGIILDADGSSVIYNLFDEFNVTETEITIDLTADEMKLEALNIVLAMEAALGNLPYDHIHVFCGIEFFKKLLLNPAVKHAYETQVDQTFFSEQQYTDKGTRTRGFTFGDIVWEVYRGSIGSIDFFDPDSARAIPVGVPDLFKSYYAPAPFMETVNTVGKEFYAKQVPNKWGTGTELHVQTNPLMMCSRPDLLLKITHEEASSS